MSNITRQTIIGELVKMGPAVTEKLLSLGVHCIGCHVAYDETVEDGLRAHGMTEQEIDDAIVNLNNAAEDERQIKVTEKAVMQLKLMAVPDKYLRISALEDGLYGFSFSKKGASDAMVICNNINIIFKKKDAGQLTGLIIDYVEGDKPGFRVTKCRN